MPGNDDMVLMSIGALLLAGVVVYRSSSSRSKEGEKQRRQPRERDVQSRREEEERVRKEMEEERVRKEMEEEERVRKEIEEERVRKEMEEERVRKEIEEERVRKEIEEIVKFRRRVEKEEEERLSQERRLQERRLRYDRERKTRQYNRRRIETYRRFNDLHILETLDEYSDILKKGGSLTDEQQAFFDRINFYINEYIDNIYNVDSMELEDYMRTRERSRLRNYYLDRSRVESGKPLWSRLGTMWEDLWGDVKIRDAIDRVIEMRDTIARGIGKRDPDAI